MFSSQLVWCGAARVHASASLAMYTYLFSVMDCKLRYTAAMPLHAHGVASCCCWVAVAFQRCIYEKLCLFVARSASALCLCSAAVTTLFANHINFAIHHNASHSSDLIGRRSTCKSSFLRVKVITSPLPLGPVLLILVK